MSLVTLLKGRGPSGFGAHSTAAQVLAGVDLSGKRYLLTGCNSGLGLETMRVLGAQGAHVIAAARTEDKARTALAEVGVDGTPVACELSDPTSVRACVATVASLGQPLAGIITNAGIMALPKVERCFGVERQLFTNHVGHFMLVTGLLDSLAPDGRVVVLSSSAHKMAPPEGIALDDLGAERGYRPWRAYGQSKLANLLFARALAKRFEGSARTANAVHPGVIRTGLVRHMNPVARGGMALIGPLFLKSVGQGAATQVYVAAHPGAGAISGEYFADCNPKTSSARGRDTALAEALWRQTEELVAGLP